MAAQIKPSVTDPSLGDIYRRIENGTLVLQPDFQRRFVWTQEHQEEFIDTILQGFPFPEIYVCDSSVDVSTLETKQEVIDGQQRLTTVVKYIKDDFQRPLKLVPPFAKLSEDQKKDFISYRAVVRNIGTVSEEIVKEVFRRINLTKFSLKSIEVQNAVYDGKFISTAQEIAESQSLGQFGVFRESEFTRMGDVHFILLIMTTIVNQHYFSQDSLVEEYIDNYNEEFPNAGYVKHTIEKTLQIIAELELDFDSIWFRKSNFFTLVCELALALDNLPKDLKSRLMALEERIIEARTDKNSEYSLYYKYMLAGTHQRKARMTRAAFFRRDVLSQKIDIAES